MTGAAEEGYVFRHRYPEREAIYRSFADRSAETRAALLCRNDVAYGTHPRQRFDLFPGTPHGPVLIFIHGGYWRSQAKESFSFVARPFVEQGCSVAIIGYPLLPDISFSALCESVRTGTAAALAAIEEMGLYPRFWALCGHSAGGHLAALLAATDWSPHGPPRGCLAISGIFDLEPLLTTSLGGMLGLDSAAAAAFSPLRIDHCRGRLLAVVGSAETEAFQAQSRAYAAHWSAQGGEARLIQLKHRHHYDILCDFMQSRSELVDHFQTFIAPD
ncbi:alpha/beta hydrolase [Aestuariivirga sp. YIM B02566]|uniref:Alpha/beta hydrolase n=1 Tax=Taklimakanibacter albus TaxID=2800327 RepID=A0ACC5R2N0_9HYPH|nr:alpha/beta hydrolase [Aestuariivirga sp. YIM B02566]MBK1866633.1 alpha/beta hydrolase [Aestuariivirga sp. YIM B02566]